jgi:hypothetical protein
MVDNDHHCEPSMLADGKEVAQMIEQLRLQAVKDRLSKGYVLAKVADPSLAQGSSAVSYVLQQLGVVRMARQAALGLHSNWHRSGSF